METYIGTKELRAKPMTRGEYNTLRGWGLPADENADDEGYLVEYLDSPNSVHEKFENYISWSPKDVFERSYNRTNGLSFGQAIEALRLGKRVARVGWNGKDLFVFMQVASVIGSDIVPRMQSLPQSVKDEFVRRFNDENEQIDAIYYSNQLAIVDKSNSIKGWAPSVSDSLATDWLILP